MGLLYTSHLWNITWYGVEPLTYMEAFRMVRLVVFMGLICIYVLVVDQGFLGVIIIIII